MELRKRTLILAIGLGIVAVALFVAAFSWRSDPIETTEDPGNSTNRIDSASTDPDQATQERQPESGREAEIDSRLRGQLATMPRVSMDEYHTASDALQSIAAWSEMSDRDLQRNVGWWNKACMALRTPNGHFPPMLETESYRSALEEFESFCSGIENFPAPNAASAEPADIDEIFDRIEKAMASPPESWPDKIERLGREGALEAAFDRLQDAIRNVDEDGTRAAILNMVRSGLYPHIEETGPRSRWGLQLLTLQLANTLLCRRIDGCRGPAHPLVVKYCLIEYEVRNRVCDVPNSIDDAIYQTLTPVEFQNYLQLYGWLTTQLARWDD